MMKNKVNNMSDDFFQKKALNAAAVAHPGFPKEGDGFWKRKNAHNRCQLKAPAGNYHVRQKIGHGSIETGYDSIHQHQDHVQPRTLEQE
jgi:hypothetical protein